MNLARLTGRISEREMLDDHPLELERLKASEVVAKMQETKPATQVPPNS